MAFNPNQITTTGTDDLTSPRQPFLRILRSGSPEIKKNREQYIEGAKEGDILFNPTKEVFESLEVIPLGFQSAYALWTPRTAGGGFQGNAPMSIKNDPQFQTKTIDNKKVDFFGELEAKRTIYCFLKFRNPTDSEWVDGVIGFASSEIRVAMNWQEKLAKNPHKGKCDNFLFNRSWTLTTMDDGNDYGDWKNWDIKDPVVLDFKKDEDILTMCNERIGDVEESKAALTSGGLPDQKALVTTPEVADTTPFDDDDNEPY